MLKQVCLSLSVQITTVTVCNDQIIIKSVLRILYTDVVCAADRRNCKRAVRTVGAILLVEYQLY